MLILFYSWAGNGGGRITRAGSGGIPKGPVVPAGQPTLMPTRQRISAGAGRCRLALMTSSSEERHSTDLRSVTAPSSSTETTFTGTATVFPVRTAVFRISASWKTKHVLRSHPCTHACRPPSPASPQRAPPLLRLKKPGTGHRPRGHGGQERTFRHHPDLRRESMMEKGYHMWGRRSKCITHIVLNKPHHVPGTALSTL